MARAFVSVGSNIDPADNTRAAVRLLAAKAHLRGISTVYLTEAEGRPEQPPYYNCVVEIETSLPPGALKHLVLRRIEDELGRKRSGDKYAPRTIDLDLILYDDLVLKTDDLTLPDPQILLRPFLAFPLLELAPALRLPGTDVRIEEATAGLSRDRMKPLEGYTALLKKEIAHGREQ